VSPPDTFIVFVVVALVLVICFGIYAYTQNKKRIDALAAFALAKGWTFVDEDASYTTRWNGAPFGEGHSRRARDVVVGTFDNHQFVSFDYTYVTTESDGRGGSHSETHHYAVSALALPTFLPAICLTPESVMTRIGHVVGMQDIELESEAFNRKYRVQCPDPKFASDVLTPRTMELLLARPTLHFRIVGADVVCWEQGTTDPTKLLARISTLAGFVAGIPAFVWHDHGVGQAPGGLQ
jgi:hypothetical protein